MDKFGEIIRLRNAGIDQEEIAKRLGLNRRTIIRYLRDGKIPKYDRSTPTRPDPMDEYYSTTEDMLSKNPRLTIEELYPLLQEKGYKGSTRTLRRKTAKLRARLKKREVYFQRSKSPGEIMEGDFTKLHLEIGGVKRRINLWVVVLPYSNSIFVTPYYYESFECFCEGSINAFEEFNGVSIKYRLDNLSPAVSEILRGQKRIVTKRYAQFQEHYKFQQDFCNPGRGNEKGCVESNNKHFKRRLLNRINTQNIKFKDLQSLKIFIWDFCREINNKEEVKSRFAEEKLSSLPIKRFDCYQLEVVAVNKYSMFSVGNSGNLYSAPSEYVNLRLEARIYPENIDLFFQGKKVAEHRRIYINRGLASINIKHIIGALCKKPGAMKEWKHRNILFPLPVWRKFYNRIVEKNKDNPDKVYLLCLNLTQKFSIENVTAAMELVLDNNMDPNSKSLKQILEDNENDMLNMRPIKVNLKKYDNLIESHRSH
ncbi:MAG: IS21 family transposase [Oligoflexia bacterium]|nr:IS21 family transposase [Oligoflexia bacterium]